MKLLTTDDGEQKVILNTPRRIGPPRKPLSWIAYEAFIESLYGNKDADFLSLPDNLQIAWRAAAMQVWAESILDYAYGR